MSTRSRSAPPGAEDELRLPRPPGVFRRFWARHPLLTDILVALLCLLTTLTPATTFRAGGQPLATLLLPLSIAACALLLRRRQWPVIVFAGSFVLAAAYLFAPVPIGSTLVLVTSYSLAVYRSSRAAWIGFAVAIGSLAGIAGLLTLTGATSIDVALNAVVSELVLALIGTLIGVNVGNRKRYLEAIIDRSRQLLRERDQQAQLAASAERARIAREMHDIVSHSLTVIVALSEGATATDDAGRARAATAQAAQTARSALREMRAMLGVLRDGDGDAPLLPTDEDAIGAAVEAARAAGFPVVLRIRTAGVALADLSRPIRFAAGRIVQEALTNAMRHAPAATRIEITVDVDHDAVRIEVRNDGARGDVHDGGYGLRGLRERAEHVGGELTAGGRPPDIWALEARLPLTDDDHPPRTDEAS